MNGPAGLGKNPSSSSCQVGLSMARTQPSGEEQRNRKGPSTGVQGVLFEIKLLSLFLIHGITGGYQFELSTSNEAQGGKFDDLIFRYKSSEGKKWSYRYMQAKHKGNILSTGIKADLLLKQDDGDYSLAKYFRSYCRMIARGDAVQDCIVCTKSNINIESLERKGFHVKLLGQTDSSEEFMNLEKLLTIDGQNKPGRLKLEYWNEIDVERWLKSSDVHKLAQKLQATNGKEPDMNAEEFKLFHVALVKENVIQKIKVNNQLSKFIFHPDFVDQDEQMLTDGAKELRQVLYQLVGSDWKNWNFKFKAGFGELPVGEEYLNGLPIRVTIDHLKGFYEKLIFAYNTPAESQFDDIFHKALSNYYSEEESNIQRLRIVDEMTKWFMKLDGSTRQQWLSFDVAKKIFFSSVTDSCLQYKNLLGKEVAFNNDAITSMSNSLQTIFEINNHKIMSIKTPSPKWTSSKIVSAIEKLPDYQNRNSCWVVSFSCLQSQQEKEWWKNRLLRVNRDIPNVFVIVHEEGSFAFNYYSDLVPDDKSWLGKIVVVNRHEGTIRDDITFKDFDKETQLVILKKTVVFQKEMIQVGQLLFDDMENDGQFSSLLENDKAVNVIDKVLDSRTLDELYQNKTIEIPWSTISEDFLYIKRRLKPHANHQSWNRLTEDCKINEFDCVFNEFHASQYEKTVASLIEERKSILWQENKKLNNQSTVNSYALDEDDLITLERNYADCSPAIICGVAGTGKSSLLRHYCKKVKETNRGKRVWLISIELANHRKILSKISSSTESPTEKFQHLLTNFHCVTNDSYFAQSLLQHRLKTGDRIVLILDGFDEIDNESQNFIILLLKSFPKLNTARLFVTTRPDSLEKLQDGLFQYAHTVEKFSKEDQIRCLTDNWQQKINLLIIGQSKNGQDPAIKQVSQQEKETLEEFARMLVELVSEALQDKDLSLVGVPLQCRILGDSYEKQLFEEIQKCRKSVHKKEGQLLDKEKLTTKLACLLKDQSFDLASLYDLLMVRKLDIFHDKMVEPRTSDRFDVYNNCVDVAVKNMNHYLIELAILAIDTDRAVNILLKPFRFQSKLARQEHERQLIKLGTRYGILVTKDGGDDRRPYFLHRTYAEYLIARHIFNGFLIDKECHNQLLEDESVRSWIINEMLICNHYQGTRVFFDSFLKRIVGSETWKTTLLLQKLPRHLKEYCKHFCEELVNRIEQEKKLSSRTKYYFDSWHFCGQTMHSTIVHLNLDCLDVTIQNFASISKIIHTFIDGDETRIPLIFTHSTEIFQRVLNYLQADTSNAFFLLNKAIATEEFKKYHIVRGRTESDLAEMTRELYQIRLDFTVNNKEAFKHHLTYNCEEMYRQGSMLRSLSSDQQFFDIFKQHVSFLLEVFGEEWFFRFYHEKMENSSEEEWIHVESLLLALKQIGKNSLLGKVTSRVLIWYPNEIQAFYEPVYLRNEVTDDVMTGLDWFLRNHDHWLPTNLHRSTFFGDQETIENSLFVSLRENLSGDNLEMQMSARKVIRSMAHDDTEIAPFFLAFIRGHVQICCQMLEFFNEMSAFDEELKKNVFTDNNCFHLAMWNALTYLNSIQHRQAHHWNCSQSFLDILHFVKKQFGLTYLMKLLKSSDLSYSQSIFRVRPMLAALYHSLPNSPATFLSKLYDDIIMDGDIIMDDDVQHSVDLIFFYGRKESIRYLSREAFQKILLTDNGRTHWIQHVLGSSLRKHEWSDGESEFIMEIDELIQRNLNENQLDMLIEEMVSTKDERPASFWADCLEKILYLETCYMNRPTLVGDILKLLCYLLGRMGDEAVNRLLTPLQHCISVRKIQILVGKRSSLNVNQLLLEKLNRLLENSANNGIMIENMATTFDSVKTDILKRYSPYEWTNMLLFYFIHADIEKRSRLIDSITALRPELEQNIWSYCVTKVKYCWEDNLIDQLLVQNISDILSLVLHSNEVSLCQTEVIILLLQDGGWIGVPSSSRRGIFLLNQKLEFGLQILFDYSLGLAQLYHDLVRILKESIENKKRLNLKRHFNFESMRVARRNQMLHRAADFWKHESIVSAMVRSNHRKIHGLISSLLHYFAHNTS